jgi:mRNA-degrading endonuclease RelE of RelBE toxin-antitoxin system
VAWWIPRPPRSAAYGVFLLLSLLPVRLDGTTPEQSYGNLDTSFEFALRERRQVPLGVELELHSIRAYPCTGYRILCSVQWSRDTLTVALLGLHRPSPCVPLASVASGSLFLGDLGDTTVVLRFTYRGHEDRYRIAFSRAGTRITPLSRGFTSVGR